MKNFGSYKNALKFCRWFRLINFLDYRVKNGTLINVYFKSIEFFPNILQRQFTLIDLVSYTGGALGLFLGVSFLSIAEIFYYFSLKVAVLKYSRRKVACAESVEPESSKAHVAMKFLKSFPQKSSIHGMNQISFSKRHIIERFQTKCPHSPQMLRFYFEF